MTLKGKVAIVTGSSSGIGQAIALALGAAGAAITINYRSHADAAEGTREKIVAAGGQALVVQADVSKLPDLQNLVDQTRTIAWPARYHGQQCRHRDPYLDPGNNRG